MVDTMVGAEKWTFRTWKSLLEDQLNSWVMYIPGMSSSKDAESLKELKGMFILNEPYIIFIFITNR